MTLAKETFDARSISFGLEEYYIEMNVSHNLTNKTFFNLKSKLLSSSGVYVNWKMSKYQDTSDYFPNIVAFPFPDFDLSITLTKVSEHGHKKASKVYVNLEKIKCEDDRLVTISTDDFELLVRIVHS